MAIIRGDSLPEVTAPAAGAAARVHLPNDLAERWAVVLFYRGNF